MQPHTHHSHQAAGVRNQLHHYAQPQLQLQQPSCDQEIPQQVSQKSDPAATAARDQVQKHYAQESPKTVQPHNDEFDQDASFKLGLEIPETGSNLVPQQLYSISNSGVQLEQQPPQPMQPPNHESGQDASLKLGLEITEQRTGLQFQRQNIQKEPRNHGFH